MNKYIADFSAIGKNDVSIAGGKGANLGEMTSAGIAVPPGAVLTAQAYEHFMRENAIDTEDFRDAADIRKAIIKGNIPDDMRDEITGLYRSMGKGARVAVRSSATAEDLEDASFAGQQETFLNVRGEEELLKKIKECYASLWGNRAVSYRRKQGYGEQKVSLAVVLQQMIESQCSGVLFTKDPTGATDDIVINASYGLGEAVVSGIVSPDEYRCDRSGNVLKSVTRSKEVMIVYGGEGTCKVPVSEALRKERVLTDEMVKRLAAEALRIEKHYGQPMDIEWAIRDDKVYILQARSITTIDAGEKTFTEADFEHLPKVKAANGKMRENVLFNLEKVPQPYLPLDHDFGDNVGRQKELLMSEFGIEMNEMMPIDEDGISSFGISGFRLNKNIFSIFITLKQLKDDGNNCRIADERLAACQKKLDDEILKSHGSVAELGEALRRLQDLTGEVAYVRFRYAIFPQVLENISLGKKLKKADKELGSFDLMAGLSFVTADINRDIAVIAGKIREDEDLCADVMRYGYQELTGKRSSIKESFEEFLDKYGNRSDFNCYCFTAHSWNEDPDRFLNTLRTMIRSEEFHIPSLEEGQDKMNALMEKMHAALGDRKYQVFEKKVNAVRHYHYIREATQYLWESIFACCRKLLKECADMLGEEYGDLLYLFAEELYEVCRAGRIDDAHRKLIEKRKASRPLAMAYWNHCIEMLLDTGSSKLAGVSGSAGMATGKVRIVRSAEEFDRLQQGEVLVCPYTDPEWTPLFTLAAAVVVDTGGSLSHAAIVAREYKIPCVLATGNATRLLKDGDTVIVDGTGGSVRVTAS